MGPFRDYRRVIQTAPRCCDTEPCAATRNQPALLRQVFRSIVERSWDPAEARILRRVASAALLSGAATRSPSQGEKENGNASAADR